MSEVQRSRENETVDMNTAVKRQLVPVRWGKSDKLIIGLIIVFGIFNLILNILTLGPDILHW